MSFPGSVPAALPPVGTARRMGAPVPRAVPTCGRNPSMFRNRGRLGSADVQVPDHGRGRELPLRSNEAARSIFASSLFFLSSRSCRRFSAGCVPDVRRHARGPPSASPGAAPPFGAHRRVCPAGAVAVCARRRAGADGAAPVAVHAAIRSNRRCSYRRSLSDLMTILHDGPLTVRPMTTDREARPVARCCAWNVADLHNEEAAHSEQCRGPPAVEKDATGGKPLEHSLARNSPRYASPCRRSAAGERPCPRR